VPTLLYVTWTFERDGQRLRLEVHEVPGTGGWEMVLRQSNGTATTEQFGRRDMVQSYLTSVQETLNSLKWNIIGEADPVWRPSLVPVESGGSRSKPYAEHGAIRSRLEGIGSVAMVEAADVYDLSGVQAEIPTEWTTAATYTLEFPAKCPHCRETLNTLRVMRLRRSQVSFTSTLPRAGNVLACPLCERIISAELSGLI